jgi:hypothetical protein
VNYIGVTQRTQIRLFCLAWAIAFAKLASSVDGSVQGLTQPITNPAKLVRAGVERRQSNWHAARTAPQLDRARG